VEIRLRRSERKNAEFGSPTGLGFVEMYFGN
jgi:hypothetical protein